MLCNFSDVCCLPCSCLGSYMIRCMTLYWSSSYAAIRNKLLVGRSVGQLARLTDWLTDLGPVWARGHCRISPPRFLAECCKRQLNQGSFVLLHFRLSAFSDLYWVCLSIFFCTVLFVSISQVIGCEDRLRNDLYCVEWGVKLYSNQPTNDWSCLWWQLPFSRPACYDECNRRRWTTVFAMLPSTVTCTWWRAKTASLPTRSSSIGLCRRHHLSSLH